MQTLLLLLLLSFFALSASAALSEKSCQELGLDPTVHGSNLVCATSRAETLGLKDCGTRKTWTLAQSACVEAGMRLCTSAELTADEAFESGCFLDSERVWTKTGCMDNGETGAVTQAGSSAYLSVIPTNCSRLGVQLGVRCCADVFVCQSNECSQTADPGNMCVPTSTGYQCVCGSQFVPGPGRSSCNKIINTFPPTNRPSLRPPTPFPTFGSPCAAKPCSEVLDTRNKCFTNADKKTYTCSCQGYRFKNSFDFQSCVYIPDACVAGACGTNISRRNVCYDNLDGTYTCSCDPPRFQASIDGTQCIEQRDPCVVADPCATSLNPDNICISQSNGTFACQCFGGRWYAATPTTCTQRADPCVNDPCSSLQDPLNVCIENDDSANTYSCQCKGVNYRNTSDLQSCEAIPQPCTTQNCRTENVGNICVGRGDGSQYCVCLALGWQASDDQQSCVVRTSACRNDPCSNSKNVQNSCVDFRNGTYSCVCAQNYYVVSLDGSTCLPAPNYCITSDPCLTRNTANKCVYSCQGETCATVCQCSDGWMNVKDATGKDTCQRTPQPCLADPCLRGQDIQNSCVDLGGGKFTCNCGGARYAPKYGANNVSVIACQRTDDFCLSPQAVTACATAVLGNLCIDTTASNKVRTFQCTCSALGWTKKNASLCTPPPNRCLEGGPGGYCAVKDNVTGTPQPGNQCIDNKDGTYACICLQPGWNANYGAQLCIAPTNFCTRMLAAGQDVCYSRVTGASNQCVDLKNGTYVCRCDTARGYKDVIGGQRCEAPINGCLANPCLQGRDPLNTCTSRPDGTWVCVCGGYDYIPDPDKPTGTACKFQLHYNECYNYTLNPLNIPNYDPKDPCKMSWNPDNSCTDFRRAVNGHECICRNGFTNGTVQSSNGIALWCLAPANICAGTSDPCRIQNGVNKFNFCVYDGNGQYHCECATRGWMVSQDTRSCRPVVNPCNANPCTTVARNTCNSSANDGTYTCNCLAPGYLNTQGNQRCVQTANLCLFNDPCSTRLNRRNQCKSFPNYYECNCLGRGWNTSIDKQSCIAPRNACLQNNDACASQFNSLNYCIDEKDGYYHCDCGAQNFDPAPNNQNCTCRSPCLLGDPCNVNENSNNTCVVLAPGDPQAGTLKDPTNCGIFKCTCTMGWNKVVTLWGTERCQPPDPCSLYDPCSSSLNTGNVCVNGYDGVAAQYNPLTDPLNPVNIAIASTAGQVTRPLPSYNSLSNYNSNTNYPLQILSSPALQSLFINQPPVSSALAFAANANTGGLYYGRRLLAIDPLTKPAFPFPRTLSFPKRKVRTQANAGDDIPMRRARLDPGDASTVFYTQNAYFCQCDATGWTTPLGAQSCLPPNKCTQGDPCARTKDILNTCTPGSRAGTPAYADVLNDPYIVNLTPNGVNADYSCNCAGHGWYPSADHRFCLPCANPCKSASDPCNIARGQSCIWEFDEQPSLRRQADIPERRQGGLAENGGGSPICGRYLCVCDYVNGWVSSQGGQICVKCGDSCVNDPCKSAQDAGNNCTNIYPPNAANANYGNGTVVPDYTGPILSNNVGFVQVLNAVARDRNFSNPCGLYQCQCNQPTWLPTQNDDSCVRCIDPCTSTDDPCRIVASGSRNTCAINYDATAGEGGIGRRRLLQLNANSYSNLATFGQYCGGYNCTCGTGYVAIGGGIQCTACVDPCIAIRTRDPCRVAQGNICTVAPNGGDDPGPGRRLLQHQDDDEVQRRQSTTLPLPSCGAYLCVCNLPNYVSLGTQQCVANCVNQCTSGADPCMTQNSTRNSCVYINAAYGEDCGHIRCTCGVGFTATFGNQGCFMNGVVTSREALIPTAVATRPSSPTARIPTSSAVKAPSFASTCPTSSDPCLIRQQGNKCSMSGSIVVCTCGNIMYTLGPTGSTCEQKCTNPAQLAGIVACKVGSLTRNVCYIVGKSWNCICATGTLKSDAKGPICG